MRRLLRWLVPDHALRLPHLEPWQRAIYDLEVERDKPVARLVFPDEVSWKSRKRGRDDREGHHARALARLADGWIAIATLIHDEE